jgi:hypothetical protein
MTVEFVYIAIAEGSGRVKIGKTANRHKRFRTTTDCPFPIRILCIVPCAVVPESRMHFAFGIFHVHKEWFVASRLVLKFANRIACGGESALSAIAWLEKRIKKIEANSSKCESVPASDMATVTTAQASVELGVTIRRIQAILNGGGIAGAKKVGRDWIIPRISLSSVKVYRKAGRPRKI